MESPNIFGPSTMPSNCCRARIKSPTQRAFPGEIKRVIKIEGIAPIKGPKYGIILVRPIIKLMIIVYGALMIAKQIKQSTPMSKESSVFPRIKFWKI